MDRITSALLAEFSQDNGIQSLPEDTRFERFASYLVVSPHLADSFDTADIATGAGSDTGIDAIAIVVNGTLVTDQELVKELVETNGYLDVTFIFVQAERSSSFEGSKIGTFGYGVMDFFKEKPTLPRNEQVAEAAAIMNAIYARSSKFTRGNPVCRLYYVTTGKWLGDANLVARRQTVLDDLTSTRLFREVDFTPLDADSVQRLYNQSKNAIARDFTFANRTLIPEMPGVSEAYLGFLPASEFLALLRDENGVLLKTIFYDNVRDWQDYNAVNSEIRQTLAATAQRKRFSLMNNGVTIIAKALRATGNRFHIEDYQIVNGCQTSHVLYDQRSTLDDSIIIPLRLIATQDDEIIASIVKATNRQTQVKEEQLLALNDVQKKLEAYFASFDEPRRLYYERRSRQYNTTPGIEKTRIITLTNLIRAYAAFMLNEPHRTTRNFKALLDKVGSSIFGADHRPEPYYTAASALYRLESLFRNGSIESKYKPARYHILMAARLLASPHNPPRPNSNEMTRFADELTEKFWDQSVAEHLFADAVAVVEEMAKGNLNRDNIRTLPFTEAVTQRCREIVPATKA
ncbi:MAG: AIPR family protein [Nitrospira sp.]